MSRNYIFVINNYNESEINHIHSNSDKFQYCIYGKEVGESGTPHLQGYIELKQTMRHNKVKDILGQRVHLEKRYGTQQEAINYCKKDHNFTEIGAPSTGGRRGDLRKILDNIELPTLDIIKIEPNNIKFINHIQKLKEIYLKNKCNKIRTLHIK